MATLMTITLALSVVNALLAAGLTFVYARNHMEIRSRFTLGLLAFALFFVAHNAIVIYHTTSMMATFTGLSQTFVLLEAGVQTVGLAALLASTLR